MSRAGATDACVYEPDAVAIGILLFGARVCARCDDPLPACTDYFAPNKRKAGGLVYECRRCRRALERDRWARSRGSSDRNFSAGTS